MNGIGLESHFSKLKFPLMKAIVDKLATLKLPIKLTETDTGYKFDTETQVHQSILIYSLLMKDLK